MVTARYPSDEVPGPTPVSINLPPGWITRAAPGVAFVATSPDDVDGGRASAVVSVRRVASELGLDALNELIGEEIAGLAGCTVLAEDRVTVADRGGVVRQFGLVDPDSGRVAHQLQLVCLAEVDGVVADAVTVTVTSDDGSSFSGDDSLRAILGSVRIG